MSIRWYVVQAYSGYEAIVKRSLEERIERYDMQESFEDILIPTEEVVEIRDGKKRKSDRKFFPGYVLVKMEMNDDSWHLVKDTPKVLGFIGGKKDQPAPISEKEVQTILNRIQECTDQPKPKVLFEVGELIRIVEGPFNEFNGTVEEVDYNKNRMNVSVNILGRSTPVELDFSQVAKA
ncbi:MAG: transcription termination/antitermination protein NusG [Pseudomonadota bacterium]